MPNFLTNLSLPGLGTFNFGLPQVAGAAALLGGAALDKEPGEVTEARQYLRNFFTSPTAITDQFSQNLSGLQSTFAPFLDQRSQQAIDAVTQQYKTAFPATAGFQGGQAQGLANLISNQIAPGQQAFLGNLGLNLLGTQEQAATDILNTSRPDPFASALSKLGGTLLASGFDPLGGLFGSKTGQGATPGGLPGLLEKIDFGQIGNQILESGGVNSTLAQQVAQALGSTISRDPFQAGGGLSGVMVETSRGIKVPIESIVGGLAGAAGSGASGFFAGGIHPSIRSFLSGKGLLGAPSLANVQGLASGAGAAGLGFAVGTAIGHSRAIPNQATSALGGAASGAALGASVAGPIGAVIGAITGGIGGIFGKSSAVHQQKAASIARETEQATAERPQALQTAATFFQNGQQFLQSAQASLPHAVPMLSLLQQNGDPKLQALMQQAMAKYPGSFTTGTGGPLPDPTNPPVESVLTKLMQVGAGGTIYDPQTGSNPESHYGLLLSNELGKFEPGRNFLNTTIQSANDAQNLFEQFFQLAQAS